MCTERGYRVRCKEGGYRGRCKERQGAYSTDSHSPPSYASWAKTLNREHGRRACSCVGGKNRTLNLGARATCSAAVCGSWWVCAGFLRLHNVLRRRLRAVVSLRFLVSLALHGLAVGGFAASLLLGYIVYNGDDRRCLLLGRWQE